MRLRRALLFLCAILVVSLVLSSCGSAPSQSKPTAPPPKAEPAPKQAEPSPAQQPSQQPAQEPAQAAAGKLELHFIDVGQGDSILVRLPNGETMLVDAGPTAAADRVVAYLKKLGVKKLDYAVFTHPHEDHIGGGPAVLKAFEVGKVFMPRTGHTTKTYENLLLAIKDKGLTVTEAKADKVIFDKDDLKAEFIGPVKAYAELNDWSAVISLRYGGKVFVLTGDASSTAEADMLASKKVPDADVLKVGHHGSASSTSEAFLKAVSPSLAVISVGAGNQYGHPAKSTLERLAAAEAKVYRTDLNGTVVVGSDGKEDMVNVEREASTTVVPPPAAVRNGSDEGKVIVYITRTGTKYHREECRYLSKSKIPITLEGAKAKGYGPCSVCKPQDAQ